MLYPVCDVPYRQHQAPTILAAMTGRTYAESKTAVKLHLSLKIKSISPSNFMTVLERCGFHVVRQYAEFDEQIWLAVDSVSQVMPEVPLVLERTAERSLSAEQAQKNARRTMIFLHPGRGHTHALRAALRREDHPRLSRIPQDLIVVRIPTTTFVADPQTNLEAGTAFQKFR